MTPIVLFLFVPPLLLLALVPYTWRHRTTPGARSFLMLLLAVAAWGICYALQLAAVPDLAVKSFWSAAKYVGIAITPVAWFAFALEYTGHGEWLTRRRFAALFIIPAITSVMAFVNPLNLMWAPLRLVTTDQFVTTDAPFGLWFWVVHTAYSYFFILAGIVLLARAIRRFPQMYQQQAGALVVAVALPLLANFIFIVVLPALANSNVISSSSPLLYLDLTSVAFTFSSLLFAWALFRYRLLDVVPVARDAVVASMTDVVIVIDLQNRIVDINPAGQQALGRTSADIIGQPVERVLANWSQLVERYLNMPEVHEEIALADSTGAGQSYFDLRVTPISDRRGSVTGRLVVLRDITQGRLAESLSDSEKRMRHRATQLQTVAEVARAITSERHLSELLPLVTRLIGERFGFYHVGIFMLDQHGEYAVLQAASSEAGQQLLAQGHQLKVGQTGTVGYVASSGLARIVTDVSRDTEFVSNPHLPLTRSEMALPLKVREQVIGVLDVQSAQTTAFTEEDTTLLATLADQVATAIENARSFERVAALAEENRRLLETSEKAVGELNALTRRLTAEGWEKYFVGQPGEIVIEDVMPELTIANEKLASLDQHPGSIRQPAATNTQALLTLPILLRGEPIGEIDLEPPAANPYWDEENVSIVKSVAERVGLALDNARLFEQTQIALSETEELYNVGLRINTAASLEDLLQAAITPSIATQASSAGIWLFELNAAQQPTQMEFVVSWTREGAAPLPLGTRLRVADYPSSGLWLNETGQPSFIGDIAQDERVDSRLRAMFQMLNIAAAAFMPLTLGSRWVGLIIVSWREPHDFAEGEQRMYQSIASQVAVAIENRRLFEQAQRRAQREARLNQIAQQLRQTTDVHSILQTATEQLSLALDTSHAQARLGAPSKGAAQRNGEHEPVPDNPI